MHYCISDIHGEFDRYQTMLEELHLTDNDTLYVIGDVIDRAPGGVDVLAVSYTHLRAHET